MTNVYGCFYCLKINSNTDRNRNNAPIPCVTGNAFSQHNPICGQWHGGYIGSLPSLRIVVSMKLRRFCFLKISKPRMDWESTGDIFKSF